MKNKYRRGLESLVVGGSIFFTSLIAKGQDADLIWATYAPLPIEPINLFINQESTPQALQYNALTTQEARNSLQQPKVSNDIASKIQGMVCWESSQLYMLNGKFSDKNLYNTNLDGSSELIFDGYDGDDPAEILNHHGTTKYFGTEGIPTLETVIIDIKHGSNCVLTGDKVKEGSSYNWQEVGWPWAAANTQPGGPNTYTPLNADTVLLYYTYLYKTDAHDKNIATIPVVWFKIVDGQYEFVASNPNVKIIMERENDKPKIAIQNDPNPNILTWNIIEANFKSASYSVNGGPKIPVGQSGTLNMNLPTGNNTITFHSDDYFRLDADSTFQRNITTPTNNAPALTIKSPSEGQEFKTDIVTLQYDITDKENDPITASYSINNGEKVSTEKSVNKQLKLQNGLYKILIYYADPTHALKDSVSFEVNKPTGIEPVTTLENKVYPNPVESNLHIIYDSNLSGNAFMSITTLDGKPVMRKKINHATQEDLNMTTYKPGMYIMRITDGKEKQTYKIIKR